MKINCFLSCLRWHLNLPSRSFKNDVFNKRRVFVSFLSIKGLNLTKLKLQLSSKKSKVISGKKLGNLSNLLKSQLLLNDEPLFYNQMDL